ncbi:hypothetical protein E1B28_012301 [Marasmius oreades]|uniref:Small ribosomal subunit protein mS41 n=1 Tax=Marasmius oreades TaxID=181124 RepID=A0A9P7RR99_9AGAR|nr:uncharacterized protein E1B28_012301 [Marasmius oreades]KAG7088289.1 hypothetical protein E1B28_012301 [Marasmius oreades]
MSFSLGLRCNSPLPNFARSFFNKAAVMPIPAPKDSINTPQDFLKAIGRSLDTKITQNSWEQFWKSSGLQFREQGLSVRDRRYTLWCMEKFRHGVPVEEFVHEPRPKKTIRGWGPTVQNGKRIRSRRMKN